ncbi:hypothetical protein [Motiliproteus sediminis]|uniref:hypothetical protein n=1 Tax=Motiliproteus sediminis TaxID=1468178 RepID=UPI001AEF5DD5|nr:hypothetical protein [Motiliproteus sediminis]
MTIRHQRAIRLLVVTLSLALLSPASSAQTRSDKGSLKQCQSVKQRIDRYTAQRRHGGSRKQMQRWQALRNDYRQRYSQLDCKRYRQALK